MDRTGGGFHAGRIGADFGERSAARHAGAVGAPKRDGGFVHAFGFAVRTGVRKREAGDMIKPGAVVVDFGVNFVDGEMCGDVDFVSAVEVASLITPVPGGTGPMTNAMLMRNVLESARRQANA